MKFRSELAGVFTIKAHGGDRGEVDFGKILGHENGEISNLILDQGISHILQNHNISVASYGTLRVGSGNSTPTVIQTGLDSPVATLAVSNPDTATKGYNAAGGYQFRRYEVQFGQGVAAGNLSEIGSGWGASNTQVFSRALIVDGSGNPTTITVLPNEFLTVTYELRRWWMPAADAVIGYDDDGTPATTTAVSNKSHTTTELATPGAPFCTVYTPFDSNVVVTYDHAKVPEGICGVNLRYPLGTGNPSISNISTTVNEVNRNRLFTPAGTIFNFTPAITKTNEFTVDIKMEFSFARRA